MRNICANCNLNCQIEEYRTKLNDLIVEKEISFLNEEVINLSQCLDEVIYKCIYCQKYIQSIANVSLNLNDIFGIHSNYL